MSKIERISAFISVIEKGSFAAAARKNHISTAAISRQVSALEAELGAQLLRRTTRHLELTEIGEQYYAQCKGALRQLQDAEIAIAASKEEATGKLTIMANRYFGIRHILPKLSEFMQLNPKLRIDFQLAERFPKLEKEGIDILFGVSVEGDEQLVRKRVATTKYVLCASPGYLKKYGTPQKPTDLSSHKYITHSMRKPEDVITFKDQEVHVNPILSLNDTYAMRGCALRDMGIINLHDYMVADALQEGTLIEILAKYQEPQKNVYLYYQQSRYLMPKIRRFIDFYTEDLS